MKIKMYISSPFALPARLSFNDGWELCRRGLKRMNFDFKYLIFQSKIARSTLDKFRVSGSGKVCETAINFRISFIFKTYIKNGVTMQSSVQSYELYKKRREKLIGLVKETHNVTRGVIVLFSGFESDCQAFRQESSFYYMTGIVEPGLVCAIDLDGTSTLYVPRYAIDRSVWVDEAIALNQPNATILGFDTIAFLGAECPGCHIGPYAPRNAYETLLADLEKYGDTIYSLAPDNADEYVMQRFMCDRLLRLKHAIVDISSCIAVMRRIKDSHEIPLLEQAIAITADAQKAAAHAIKNSGHESDVCAALESVMIQQHARPSFPSIIAGGYNGTILHYTSCNKPIGQQDLVVVDIGAEYEYYAADITRTYPASGTFSPRQREIYQLVLDAQAYVAQHAQPGYWLKNQKQPEKSLHHLAVAFFKERGYAQYFPHGIGHYLGIDVHDVGSYQEPLAAGDVITIEPGLYIRDECIGVRIEDNYLITAQGAECLSSAIPKDIHDIEQMLTN